MPVKACDLYAPAFFQLGVCYSEVKECLKAKEMYRKAVQLQPGYVEALNNLGVACRELGEWEHAIEAYGMALKANCEHSFHLTKTYIYAIYVYMYICIYVYMYISVSISFLHHLSFIFVSYFSQVSAGESELQ